MNIDKLMFAWGRYLNNKPYCGCLCYCIVSNIDWYSHIKNTTHVLVNLVKHDEINTSLWYVKDAPPNYVFTDEIVFVL